MCQCYIQANINNYIISVGVIYRQTYKCRCYIQANIYNDILSVGVIIIQANINNAILSNGVIYRPTYKIQDTNQFIGNLVGWIGIYIIHKTIQAYNKTTKTVKRYCSKP